ncbi:PAS domain S-box protein [Novispirillum sp. DQ9]|uniref:PAS domain S-box protein n=1 Tax=Novispirillum sp. DQ9 TaxID=3398612 RepID=UPI003C7D9FD3
MTTFSGPQSETAGDVARRDVLGCPPETSVATAAALMRERGCGSIVVMDGVRPVGIWTERDAARTDFADPAAFDVPVSRVMSTPVRTVPASAGVEEVAAVLQGARIRHVVVVDDAGALVGMLSQTDLTLRYGVEHFLRLCTVGEALGPRFLRLPASTTVAEAARRMVADGVDAAVVDYADGGHGIITERDLVRLVAARAGGGELGPVASRPLRSIGARQPLLDARRTLADGGIRHLAVAGEDGALVGLLSMRDILEVLQRDYVTSLTEALRERDAALVRQQEELFLAQQVIESSVNAVMVVDADGCIENVNPAFARITGHAARESIGRPPDEVLGGEGFFASLLSRVDADGHWRGTQWSTRRDGVRRAYALTAHTMSVDRDGRGRYAVVFHDATELVRAEEERRIAAIAFDTISPMMLTDDQARILRVNDAFTTLTGYSAEEAVGQRAGLLKSGLHDQAFYSAMWDTLLRTGHWQGEVINRRRNGELYPELLTISAVTASDGRVTHYVGSLYDLSERKRTQATLREERDLIAAGPSVVFKWRPAADWPVTYVSPNVRNVFGYDPQDLLSGGIPFAELIHPDDVQRIAAEVAAHLASGKVRYEQKYRLRHADGSWRWIEDFTTVVRDAAGEVTSINGYVIDVTEREHAAREAEAARAYLTQLLAALGEAVYGVDLNGRCTFINRSALDLLGFREAEVLGRDQHALFHHSLPDGRPYAPDDCPLYQTLRDGRSRTAEEVFFRKGGSAFSVTLTTTPLLRDGAVVGAVASFHDITEELAAQRALRDSEERYRLAQTATGVGIWDWDVPADRVLWDAACWAMLGHPPSDRPLTLQQWREMLHPDDREMATAGVQAQLDRGGEFVIEFRYGTAEGTWLWVQGRGRVVARDQHGAPLRMMGTHTDISVRKRVEDVLQSSRNRLDQLLTASPAVVYAAHPRTYETTYISANASAVFGQSPEEILGTPAWWTSSLHPDDRERVLKEAADWFAGGAEGFLKHSYRLRRGDGTYVWVEDQLRTLRGAHGEVTELVGSHVDISAAKEAEEALRRSNAELEQFAYVASHDLRQPLRMITSYTQLLERTLVGRLEGDSKEFMDFVRDGAQRMDQMLVSLLEYSRVGRLGEPMTELDSRALAEEALRFLAPAIDEAGAEVRLAGDWPKVVVSRNEGVRLFQNLVGNAVKYRAPDHPPVIDLDVRRMGTAWCFSVRDNGIGIDPKQFDRLFKVFQRLHTRSAYEGTGVGLAVSRKIVERHGGRIWVESEGAGRGTTFLFTLPDRKTAGPDA